MQKTIFLGHDHTLTAEEVSDIAHTISIKVGLTPKAVQAVKKSRATIHRMIDGKHVIYGVTTGFGNFKNKFITKDHVNELQKNLIRSHSVGVGDLLSPEAVRAGLVVRLNSLCQGYSGVRFELLKLLCEIINRGIVPVVPSQGSVGSSGDLAPLSHMGLVLMGEGEAFYKGVRMSGAAALKKAGLKPIEFAEKEGLAWNNGTSVMTGISALVVAKAERLVDVADCSCALTLEAVCGVSSAYDPKVHALRPHPGQKSSASHIRELIKGSALVDSAASRIQDAYSLRCTPQVHGAVRDAVSYVSSVVSRELNSVTDNPLIFSAPDEAISGGNFHGEPIAIAMDAMGIALSELANISERRTAKLMDSSTNEGLPMFLVGAEKAGLHSGLMMVQYTAAALVSENKVLAHPASVDSIPTSANQEDHVSMGTIAARKAATILANVENVIAIEVFSACQAINFRDAKKLGKGTRGIFTKVRKIVSPVVADRQMSIDIAKVRKNLYGIIA